MSVTNQDFERIDHLISSGQAGKAVQLIKELEVRSPSDPNLNLNKGGFLIDCGFRRGNEKLIRKGIESCFNALKGNHRIKDLKFNIANGYYNLWGLKQQKKIDDENLQKSKCYYREALEMEGEGSDLSLELWTNFGNCYASIGRSVEAIECYENVLKIDPGHPMAMGNKGIALFWFSSMLQEHKGTFLVDAHTSLKKAIAGDIDAATRRHFEIYMKAIEECSKDKSVLESPPQFSPFKPEYESDFHESYVKFCRKNLLYLNPCIYCQKCMACIGDPIFISMITEVDDGKSFYKFASYLNQLKQEYITARYLFFQSQHKTRDLKAVDKDVTIINTLDYSEYNIHTELLKISFRIAVNLLDKIAFFLNDYLGLGMSEHSVSFYGKTNIWKFENKMSKEIQDMENPSLNALYDIYLDFDNKYYEGIRDLRNKLTHRHLVVQDSVLGGLRTYDMPYIKYDEFFGIVLTTMKLSRSAIIYLINFVNHEETKKRQNSPGFIGEMFVDKIPDDFK